MSDVKVWMPIYVGDWDADTRDLSCEEDGAYWRLIRHYWRRGAPPDADRKLATIVGVPLSRWVKMRPALIQFFELRDGVWFHKRVEHEIAEASKRKQKATNASRTRWGLRAPSIAQASTEHMLEPCPSPSPSPEGNDAPTELIIPLQSAGPDSRADGDPGCAQGDGWDRAKAAEALRELGAAMSERRLRVVGGG